MSDSDKLKKKTQKALKALYQKILNETDGLIKHCMAKKGSIEYAYQAAPKEIMNRLFDEYNTNLIYVEEVININFLRKIKPSDYASEMFGQLFTILPECVKIITILEDDKKDNEISLKYINQLNSLKEDVESVNILDFGIKKNIEKSIDHFEKGEIICSALFASRVISYTIDQFSIDEGLKEENEAKKNKDSYINLIITDCIAKGLIDKDNKGYISNLLQYIKLARNKLTHNILFFPEAAECLGILSISIELIKIKNKFDDYNISESNNTE